MDLLLLLKALVMGIVEGLTEFLPVSSTGHLIITGELLNFLDKAKRGVFELFIQLGAILAICWEYRAKLTRVVTELPHSRQAQRFAANLLIAFIPAAIFGLLLGGFIKAHLFSAVPVAIALVVGGFVILWAERRPHRIVVQEVEDMRWSDALKVGLAQCFALIPGTSRSGATIIGGLLFGLSRKAATEFSFFLAIPTLTAAAAYDLIQHRDLLSLADADVFAVGFVAAFVSAFVAVRALLRYISRHDFSAFAYYRIVFGVLVLVSAYAGWVDWNAPAVI